MTSPVPPITISSPTILTAPLLPLTVPPPVPKSFRTPALRRLGVRVRSTTAIHNSGGFVASSSSSSSSGCSPVIVSSLSSLQRGTTNGFGSTADYSGNNTAVVAAVTRMMVHSASGADGGSGNSGSAAGDRVDVASPAAAGEFVIDAGVETRPPVKKEVNPLPKFLRQTKGEMHAKFTDLEWQARQRLLEGLKASEQQEAGVDAKSPWTRLKGDDVALRNRYLNVDPYENNRIRLNVPANESDYINASPIRLSTTKQGEKRYVATQGPKESTSPHFWRMIFDSSTSPAVIIMLTQPVEANREKCFQYYPLDMTSPVLDITDPEDPSFGITITMQSIHEDDSTQTTIRELLLRSADGTREKKVWHLLYASWPDFLVPEGEDRDALLRLVKFSQKLAGSEQQSSGNQEQPERIVHCSAGVGRTGTFIALDWLIDELDAGALDSPAPVAKGGADESGEVDESADDLVVDLVDRLRQQRMMMIQGEMQFSFLYEVLGDLWLQRWKVNHVTE